MTHIDQALRSELKRTLEAEKASLMENLSSRGTLSESGDWQGSASSKGEEADPTDVADNIEELATNVSLVEELEGRLRDVDAALEKIEKGTYGICEVGGEEISLERLKANPSARTCVEHAA